MRAALGLALLAAGGFVLFVMTIALGSLWLLQFLDRVPKALMFYSFAGHTALMLVWTRYVMLRRAMHWGEIFAYPLLNLMLLFICAWGFFSWIDRY